MTDRQTWLLLFLGADPGPYPVDQVRTMKAMFLIDQKLSAARMPRYRWEAFDYGPFNSNVYRDLDSLQIDELVDVTRVLGSNRRLYTLSERGRRAFEERVAQTPASEMQWIQEVKTRVSSTSYEDLLRGILREFPEYAMRSSVRAAGD